MVAPSRVGQVDFLRSLEVLGEEPGCDSETTSTRDRLSDGNLSISSTVRKADTYLSLGEGLGVFTISKL